ncbi:hypothetical protein H4Q26_008164 [Puccinia striiformis f. sp. tritici PST-130]|nr:hypothetical protein H4Q26_008164 [Puccinia striiformis f. sp. tritici PST-130]
MKVYSVKFQDQRTIFIPSRLGTLMILKKWRMSTCEKQLMNEFAGKTAVAFPRFDLMPSGTGPEGHTCSLFPGYDLSKEDLALNNSPKPLSTRITPVLNYAHKVAFVAIGESKKESFETCSIILNQAFLPLSSNLSLLDKSTDGLNRIKLNLKDQPFTVDGTQVDYTTRRSISLNHQNQSQAGTKPPKSLTSCKITSPLMGPSRGVALVEQIENSWGSTSSVKFLGPNLLKSRTMINRGYLLVGHGKIILVC